MKPFLAFDRRMVSTAFHSYEIECELRERNLRYFFSSKKVNCVGVKQEVESLRQLELYPHDCGEQGRQRCPFLDIMDASGRFALGTVLCEWRQLATAGRETQ